jgi:hypothetical protein
MKVAAVTVQVILFKSWSPLELDDPDGVEPGRLHKSVPTALQEAKPKAGTIFRHLPDNRGSPDAWGYGPQTGVKPRSQSDRTRDVPPQFLPLLFPKRRQIDPTKINRGARPDEQARGPGRSEMTGHPPREQTCEGR